MISFNNQNNDPSLPSKLDELCAALNTKIQSERDENAYSRPVVYNGQHHIVIEHSRGKDLYAIIGHKGAYDFMRVFVV